MKRLASFALALVLLAGQALATTYTSTKSSTWSDTTAWTPTPGAGGPSGDGNLVVLANGFTITLDSAAGAGQNGSVTIGDSATPANLAISNVSGGSGILVVNSGCTLTVLSNVTLRGSATWTFNAGSSLVFSHASTSPVWTISESGQNAKLVFSGSSGSHCTVSSSGAAKGRFNGTNFSTSSSNLDATYTDFTSVGDSSNASLVSYHNSSSGRLNLQNCTFTSCGQVSLGTTHAAGYVNVDSCTWTSTVATRSLTLTSTQSKTSGTRVINNCYVDAIWGASSSPAPLYQDYTITGNAFVGDCSFVNTSAVPWAQFSNNLMAFPISTGGRTLPGELDWANDWNYFHYHSNSASQGYHGLSPSNYITGANKRFGGFIMEPGDTDSSGDFIVPSVPGSSTSMLFDYILFLPRKDGIKAGKLLSVLGIAPNLTFKVEHCTGVSDGQGETGLMQYAETYKGRAGMCTSFQSNLTYDYTANNGPLIQTQVTGTSTSRVTTDGTTSTVTGTSTKWLTGNDGGGNETTLAAGDYIRIASQASVYLITNVASDTSLTVSGTPPAATSAVWAPAVKDFVTTADYNATYNGYVGTDGRGYNSGISVFTLFSSAPGTHDITLSSMPFVDPTRNIGTWAIAKGQALPSDSYNTRVTAAYAYIKGSPSVRIKDLVRYVKAGWSVKRISLKNAGHDGATIGALPYVSPGSGAAILPAASNPPRRLKPAA